MDWLAPTWAIYQRCVVRGAQLATRNYPVAATIFAYGFVLAVSGSSARYLGMVGGFLVTLVSAFCAGSFLSLVENIVRSGRVTWADFRTSFGSYVGEVLGVMFTFWIFGLVLSRLVMPLADGALVLLLAELVLLIVLNPLPELIYLGRHSLLELLSASYSFIVENWLEWFPLNVVLLLLYGAMRAQPLGGMVGMLLETAASALFVYFFMIVRGLLFLELQGTTRRSRSFRYRASA